MIKRIVLGVAGLGLVSLVVLRIVQASRGAPPAVEVDEIRAQTGIPVEIALVAEAPLVVRRGFTGVLRGIRSATIRARTGDEIVELPVHVGQRVRAGEVVIRQSSQGSMAAVRQAEAAYEQAKRTVDRLRPLRERGAISEQDWDTAVTGMRVAEANLDAARRNVDLASPIGGIVTDVLLTRGSMPEPGDPLMRVSDLSRVQVLIQASVGQVGELAVGQPARLAEHGLEGRVSRVALQADPDSRLLEVELTFPGPGSLPPAEAERAPIVPGTLVNAEIEVGRRARALLVPEVAVRDGAVWVVDAENVARHRTVTAGLVGDGMVEILSGLSAGDRVVVAGASLLSEGARTRVVGGPTS
jgi:membrane fusion protein (multidrug efflux system)